MPDPVQVLCRLIADLTGKNGELNIPGLYKKVARPGKAQLARIRKLPFNEAKFKREAGMMKGMTLAGEKGFSVYEKLWTRPSLTVIAFEARAIQGSSNQIIDAARARLSLRTVPNMDAQRGGPPAGQEAHQQAALRGQGHGQGQRRHALVDHRSRGPGLRGGAAAPSRPASRRRRR